MSEIAIAIVDPAKNRWAQLLDDQKPIRKLLPVVVHRLNFPEHLNYELAHAQTGETLKPGITLAAAGVLAGAELLLRPVEDSLLEQLLDALYDEAKDKAKDKLWDMAKDKLKEIMRLDPDYPDPDGLREEIEASSSADSTQVKKTAEPAKEPRPAAKESAATKAAPQALKVKAAAAAATKASAGIPTALWIGGGLAVAGFVTVGLVVAGVVFATQVLPNLQGGGEVVTAGGEEQPGEVVLGTGDVQVTLRWQTAADLDLHVTDPGGEEIFYSQSTSSSGGMLDVDANANCPTDWSNPVENIYWPTGGAPRGTYSVSVFNYSQCLLTSPTDYTVVIKVNGQEYGTYYGTVSAQGEEDFITTFEW